jgi:hypothetical protein
MKKHLLILIISVLIFTGTSAFVWVSSSGIAGQTGAPGEGTCSGCHSGGGGVTTVSISAVPAFTNNEYVAGQTYTLSIIVTIANFS